MRSRSGGVAGNPVLIGAATTLVIVVAMFLSYNANNGLPFVPTYSLKADVPSAANLVEGNEVRIGGARVGAIYRNTAEPSGRRRASMSESTPTREPPMRTSLPRTRFAAFGTTTLRS